MATDLREWYTDAEFRFFAGDWSEVHQILPYAHTNEKDHNYSPGLGQAVGCDVILMAETVYSISALPHLYELIKKVTCSLVSGSFHFIKFLLHGSKILYFQ